MDSFQKSQQQLLKKLPAHLARSIKLAPGLKKHLRGVDVARVNSAEMLAKLPILRKNAIMAAQKNKPPFGGFVNVRALNGGRIFCSPGPVYEPEQEWGGEQALAAAGVKAGDIVHNSFSHHLTPGGFIMDSAIRSLGAVAVPGGVGDTDNQVRAISAIGANVYCGTPDYLKVLLDVAKKLKLDISSIKRAVVSGGALYANLRKIYERRGIKVFEVYATADIGAIAYQTTSGKGTATSGMTINKNLIVEICNSAGEPVSPGEVGEIVITNFSRLYPLVRFATGDLSALTKQGKLKGWLGRADQRIKVKGMFIDPAQIDELCKKQNIKKAKLVVTRKNNQDQAQLLVTGKNLNLKAIETEFKKLTKIQAQAKPA